MTGYEQNGRTVLITGAAGGLGTAVCLRLAKSGYKVLACDLREKDFGDDNIIPFRLDVTDDASAADCREFASRHCEYLYALVNLAGVFCMESAAEGPLEGLQRSLEVNLVGMKRITTALLPLLKPGKSRIINMSSEIGRYSPQPFNGDYAISKHAVDVYTDVLRRELMFAGIPVGKIQAGSFGTQMLAAARAQYDAMLASTERFGRELTVLAPIMMSELEKGYPPELFARLIEKELSRKKPRRCVRIKNSAKLSLLDCLPEGAQDVAYKAALRVFGWFPKYPAKDNKAEK